MATAKQFNSNENYSSVLQMRIYHINYFGHDKSHKDVSSWIFILIIVRDLLKRYFYDKSKISQVGQCFFLKDSQFNNNICSCGDGMGKS